MLDCSFANSKDAPTSGLLAERFLPLSGFCFIPVGLQVPMDGPLSCSPSYYRKGPRIGPNRRIISWTLGPLCGQQAFQALQRGKAERVICQSLIGSPPCWISPEYTVSVPSLHPVFSRCTPPTPEHQEQQDFKCRHSANPNSAVPLPPEEWSFFLLVLTGSSNS